MKYIVYITTNLKNGKIYVGVHKTKTPHKFDGYIGNGVRIPKSNPQFKVKSPSTHFKKAVNKYGAKHFIRIVLSVFEKEQDAYDLEQDIVTEAFIKSDHTYNLRLGGSYSPQPKNKTSPNKGEVNAKKVVQYSKSGYKKRTFKSIAEAARHINISYRGVGECCSLTKNHRSAGGYQWRFESDNLDSLPPLDAKTSSKEVERVYNDLVINTYKNSNQAAKDIGFPKMGRSIRKACSDNKEFKGYFWRHKIG